MPRRRAPSASASPDRDATRRRSKNAATQAAASDDEDAYGNAATQADVNSDQMVKNLVRLALACEYSRQPIRRQAIREKVFGGVGGGAKLFKHVFEQAQVELGSVFGMEMVELPAAERVTVAQKRAAKSQSQSQSKTPQSYILTSILPHHLRDPAILSPPAAPTATSEAQYTALYSTLIALIALSGGTLANTKMERYIRRLGIEDRTPIPSHPKTELLLKRMMADGYLVRTKESTGAGGEDDVVWTVGPRGKVEVGEEGVKGLTRAVYGEGVEEAELERRMDRSLGIGERVVVRTRDEGGGVKKKRGRKAKSAAAEEDEEEEIEYE